MTKKDFQKLRKWLPTDAVRRLATKFNHSEDYIRRILRGERNNPTVIESAIEMAQAEKQRQEVHKQKIAEL